MLRLEKVSKYYSHSGVVSTGFSKVSLEFERGEFVAITGESGSGKSTLLNVISGLDTYEEGEMLILGHPTSGYTMEEMEEYRKKYVVNIFQSFNLISSYTVYQNVELILLMNGEKPGEVREKINRILERVGLKEYRNTKTSKLSGGQKQRVAIARALAKDTPIIIADEPTGNLDSVSASEIIELLHEVSKERLVIIVTHNYEQVEKHVTRKITMSDGKVVEDRKISTPEPTIADGQGVCSGAADIRSLLRLGIRNTFNIPAKFVLLLCVFLFLCFGTVGLYASVQNMGSESANGYNNFFHDSSEERLLLTKEDRSEFTETDYEKLKQIPNVKEIVKNDLSLDSSYNIENENFYLDVRIDDCEKYREDLKEGKLPEKRNEAILIYPSDDENLGEIIQAFAGKKTSMYNNSTGFDAVKGKLKITGYGTCSKEQAEKLHISSYWADAYICLSEKTQKEMEFAQMQAYCSHEIEFGGSIVTGDISINAFAPSDKVPEGKIFIPEEISMMTDKWPVGQELKVKNKSMYFKDSYTFTVGAVYKKDNVKQLLDIDNLDETEGKLYLNPDDYKKLYDKGNFQSSVMVEDKQLADETAAEIKKAGFEVFKVSDGMVSYSEGFDTVTKVIRLVVLIGGLVVMFFISYFIIRMIMKSRNIYFSTVRILGGTRENCRALLKTDLFAVFNISYALSLAVCILIRQKVILEGTYLSKTLFFLDTGDFIILYVLLLVVCLLLAGRYSKQLFRESAMNTYREVA